MTRNQPAFLSSFGRNRGRALSAHQQRLMDELLPLLKIRTEELGKEGIGELGNWGAGETVIPELASSKRIAFGNEASSGIHLKKEESWIPACAGMTSSSHPAISQFSSSPVRQFSSTALEIGFGTGEHLLAQAAHHPEMLYIGCEPYLNGVAKCLTGIDQQKLTNIRIFTGDARLLIEQMAVQSVNEIFILFPDPWPKLRHNKRRLINSKTLEMLARIHKSGGRLLIATDHVDYSAWILEHVLASPYYQWTAKQQADWKNPPKDWTQTKYQRKTSEQGRAPVFIECLRN